MLTLSEDLVKIEFNKEGGYVHYEWFTAPSGDELKEALNHGLEVVKTNGATKWLGDVQKMGSVDPDVQEWINSEWFPAVLQLGIKKMAVVLGEDIFNQLSVEEIMTKVEGVGFVSQNFASKEEAINWLKED